MLHLILYLCTSPLAAVISLFLAEKIVFALPQKKEEGVVEEISEADQDSDDKKDFI